MPESALLTADLAGSHQVLVAVAADRLQIRITAPGGQPGSEQTAAFGGIEPDGVPFDLQPRPCGRGCYELAHEWRDGVTQLTIAVANPDAEGGVARLEIEWPPGPDRTELLTRAVATTRAFAEVTVTETVSSGLTATVGPAEFTVSGETYISSSPFAAGADHVREVERDADSTTITFAVSGEGTWHRLRISADGRILEETLVDPGHRIDRLITYGDEDGDR